MLHRLLACFLFLAAWMTGQVTFSPQRPAGNAQQPNETTKRYPVSGTVVDALTGAPIARAVVRLQGMEPAQTFTGDDGHFELKDVAEGGAFLSAQRPGFQVPTRSGNQQITVGASTSSVQLKLMPQSSLRGRVRSSDGEPVEGVPVQLLRRQVVNGVREWFPAIMGTTDETGSFELDDLQPGAYLLQTRPHRVFSANTSVVVDGRHFPDLYPAQYYPNAPDRSSAQPLQLQPGADAQIDLTLTAVPSYKVSGTINGSNSMISCESPDGEIVSSGVRIERNGAFSILQLPSGPCLLRARAGGGPRGGEVGYAELPINVGSADVNGLQLNLESLPEIPLVITGATPSAAADSGSSNGGKTASNTGANVQLLPRRRAFNFGAPMLDQKGDTKAFTGVTPGVYRASVQVFGGACLGTVTSGSIDLLRSDLTVSPGGSAAPIEVSLRKDCGFLTVKIDSPNPNDPISVLLLPEAAPSQARLMSITGGSLTIRDLSPGDYRVYAAPDLSDFAYSDPEALKGADGQKVAVGPNAQATIQVQPKSVPGGNQ